MEIDGASNRNLDDVRDLREKVNFAPNSARYKVYIIDEVHMLTPPAFNALLKTLEEPPPHAIFVLATTEPHQVLPTIISRCQRFDFRRLTQADVVGKLQDICRQEGIQADSSALGLIAKAATGSLRDAENLLEQIVLQYGPDFTREQADAKLGVTSDFRVPRLAEQILSKDVAAGLTTIGSVAADGVDLRQFNHGLVEYLRGLLLTKAGVHEVAGLTAEAVSEMKRLAAGVSMADISKATKLFGQIDFRSDSQSTLLLELALVDCSLAAAERPRKAPVRERTDSAKAAGAVRPRTAPKAVSEEQTPHDEKPVAAQAPEVTRVAEPVIIQPPATSEVTESVAPGSPLSIEQIRHRWDEFINACKGVGSSGNLDALLRRACEAVALEGDTLVLGFYWDYHMAKIEDRKYRHLVEKKLQDVFGIPYHVRCILTPKGKEAKSQQRARNPVVNAALSMGARIIEEESAHDE
jgi:DNA polymerase-3 subunit gamma/tau